MAGATTTVNAASKALAVAMQDYLDGLNAGVVVKFIPVPGNLNGTALNSGDFPVGFGTGDVANGLAVYYHTIRKTNTAADNMIYSIDGLPKLGYLPIYWKIAAANSMSLADA
jgi:hypothetical protein